MALPFMALLLISANWLNNGEGYDVGAEIQDFKLKNIDGEMVSLSDYSKAKGFIITFTCNHCPYAKLYESRIMDLDKKFASQGYPVIAINPNDPTKVPEDSFENMQKVAEEKGYSFPYLLDETQEVAKRFGATRTPHVYVVEKNGDAMIVKYIGAIDNNTKDGSAATEHYVEDAINSLKAGKEVPQTKTKAIGCTIKWKG